MKLKSIVAVMAIATASAASFASTVFVDDTVSFDGLVAGPKNTLFTQVFTFTGLSNGVYDVEGSIAGTALTFTNITLNGTPWTQIGTGKYRFGEIFYTGASPFQVSVSGIKGDTASSNTKFAGSLTVTPVPEPETFAMMLAGLCLMGAIARRRGMQPTV